MKTGWLTYLAAVCVAVFLGGCGGGGSSGGDSALGTDPVSQTTLRISGLNPGSAGPARLVRIDYTATSDGVQTATAGDAFDHASIRIVVGGTEVTPESVAKGRATFRVPDDLDGDRTLFLRAGDVESNTLLFTVSDSISVLSPEPEDWIEADDGTRVVRNLVLLFIDEGRDLDAVAAAAAAAEAGEVVGRIDPLRAQQLRLPTLTYEQLTAAIERLEAMDGVSDAIMDIETLPDSGSIDWTRDPDVLGQRASNRVEEGAQAYISRVHPTSPGAIVPYLRSIGVYEAGVHFGLDDYAGYASRGGSRSGGIALYAPDRGTSESDASIHGSNVLGLIAAELGDGGSAGLLRALGEVGAHGGVNINVNNSGLRITGKLAHIANGLEAGARVFNVSAGGHRCDQFKKEPSWVFFKKTTNICIEGLLQSNGAVVTNNPFAKRSFEAYQSAFSKLTNLIEQQYPNAIFVVTAGNGNTDAGDITGRFFSSHPGEQVLVVGAHDNAPMPEREWYSNYGERVDIAAAGLVSPAMPSSLTSEEIGETCLEMCKTDLTCLSRCLTRLQNAQGTSLAAPLVTATIAAMRSIDPELTPAQVRNILRSTALPIESNEVVLRDRDGNRIGETVFTRALTAEEVGDDPSRLGKGARLNVEGAILAAIESRAGRSRREGDRVDVEISGRETVTRNVNVTIPTEGAVFDRVDIMFLVDVSASYGGSIAEFKRRSVDLVRAFEASGTNVHTGLASFSDFPITPWGSPWANDYAYRLDQALSGNGDDTAAAINRLALLTGGDVPESQLEALYQLATGAGRTVGGQPGAEIPATAVGWRDGALRVIFLATDANFHNPEPGTGVYTPGYPGASWNQTVNALKARNIRVFGLERGFSVADVRAIVEQTNGAVFQLDSASSQIVEAVQEALEGVSASFDLRLVPNGDFARIVRSITPEVVNDVKRGDTISFTISFSRGDAGPGEHVFVFRLEAVADGEAVIEEIPVVVDVK